MFTLALLASVVSSPCDYKIPAHAKSYYGVPVKFLLEKYDADRACYKLNRAARKAARDTRSKQVQENREGLAIVRDQMREPSSPYQ